MIEFSLDMIEQNKKIYQVKSDKLASPIQTYVIPVQY